MEKNSTGLFEFLKENDIEFTYDNFIQYKFGYIDFENLRNIYDEHSMKLIRKKIVILNVKFFYNFLCFFL